jgi:hypothetical protein
MSGSNSFVGAMVGMRRSGKTTLAVDLLQTVWRYRFSMVVIISRTISLQEDVWKRLAGTGVLLADHLDMKLLEKIKYFAQGPGGYDKQGRRKEIILICDDIGKVANFWAKRVMGASGLEDQLTYLAYASRHYGISLLYLAQDLVQMGMGYRKNFDFVYCLDASIQDQQMMYVELLSNTFPSCQAFKKYYLDHTGNFKFFLIYKESGKYFVWPVGQEIKKKHATELQRPSFPEPSYSPIGSTSEPPNPVYSQGEPMGQPIGEPVY